MSTTTATNTPRVWVGCLACYNSGRLVGAWYDASEAETDLHQIHLDGGYTGPCDGEEPWVFDHESLPGGEMDPATAQRWGEVYDELGDDTQWPALLVYAQNNHGMPEVSDFQEAYRGEFGQFSDYAYDFAQETGLQQGWPDVAVRHFDWSSYAEELEQDYQVYDSLSGVYVFSN